MNFLGSLNRGRREFSEARAKNLAIEAKESKDDLLREINKKIRDLEAKLRSIEDDVHQDDLIVALKKGASINVRKDVVEARYTILFELRNLYVQKRIMERDTYFDLDPSVEVAATGNYEELVTGVANDDDEAAVATQE